MQQLQHYLQRLQYLHRCHLYLLVWKTEKLHYGLDLLLMQLINKWLLEACQPLQQEEMHCLMQSYRVLFQWLRATHRLYKQEQLKIYLMTNKLTCNRLSLVCNLECRIYLIGKLLLRKLHRWLNRLLYNKVLLMKVLYNKLLVIDNKLECKTFRMNKQWLLKNLHKGNKQLQPH